MLAVPSSSAEHVEEASKRAFPRDKMTTKKGGDVLNLFFFPVGIFVTWYDKAGHGKKTYWS